MCKMQECALAYFKVKMGRSMSMPLPIFSFNFNDTVVLLIFRDTIAYQNIDLTVGRTSFIISHDMQLI